MTEAQHLNWSWRVFVGMVSIGQAAVGLVFFLGTPLRDAAPFGLALCAGIGILSATALINQSLVRVAIAGNVLLGAMAALGMIPVVIGLVTRTADPALVWNALCAGALATGSISSAFALRKLWPARTNPGNHQHTPADLL